MKTHALFLETPCRYADALALQQELHNLRLQDKVGDTVLFLEHQPVVTLGRRGRTDFLLATPEVLMQQGIDLVVASRGGDVTYHGPGQLVMYPILKLGAQEADAHGYLENLERIAIETARAFGVEAFRREGMSGAWTAGGKLAAIGFHIKRWVTLHGLGFNVEDDVSGFTYIVGCGLQNEPVTSLVAECEGAVAPGLNQVRDVMCGQFERVLGRPVSRQKVKTLSGPTDLQQVIRLVRNP